jgi:glycosyltransferase involved in cell wall biosynthesis
MPNKLFESTFAGLPIVGGDSKELADFVKRFNLGLPTNCHDPQDMADKIVAVYESRNKFRKGRGEIDAIYKHYGWPTMETKLVAFYDDMLEET